MTNWNERLHIYQVLNSILVNFNKEYPKLKTEQKVKKVEKPQKAEKFSFFNFELEKIALNEILNLLKDQRESKKISENQFKALFPRYLNEIKRIHEIN